MKASILMSTYNKNECLSNTLYSISKQKTSFPFEVCIADDGSKIDPEPIIRKFLPDAKYKKYEHIGFEFILSKGLTDLVDPTSDIVIIQSCDVLYSQPFIVEEICKSVKPNSISMAEVKCLPIKPDMFENFDNNINYYLNNWEILKGKYYSGSRREPNNELIPKHMRNKKIDRKKYIDYYFFLGAMFKKDLYRYVHYDICDCDCVVNYNLKFHKIKPIYMDNLKGIHQLHKRNKYPGCSLLNTCKVVCRRKMAERPEGNKGMVRL